MAVTRLRILLLDVPVPQVTFCAAVGIRPPHLSNYALGIRPIPDRDLARLSAYFAVPPHEIVGYAPDELATYET
jgi:hypothetical protein